MKTDFISEIGIDNEQRLYIKPLHESFPFIYREAMGVNWNSDEFFLFSPQPRDCSYLDWYGQLITAAFNQGVNLKLTSKTVWINISEETKAAFIEYKWS